MEKKYSIRIRELRIDKGWTQKEFASVLMTTNSSVCDWERGRTEPSIDNLIKMSEVFETSIDYIVGKKDD